jgi:hypothetical protein|tara:strand:+ start:35 stop:319 length:285 start_codon:yes stop_codon:yes gene_type:complete
MSNTERSLKETKVFELTKQMYHDTREINNFDSDEDILIEISNAIDKIITTVGLSRKDKIRFLQKHTILTIMREAQAYMNHKEKVEIKKMQEDLK